MHDTDSDALDFPPLDPSRTGGASEASQATEVASAAAQETLAEPSGVRKRESRDKHQAASPPVAPPPADAVAIGIAGLAIGDSGVGSSDAMTSGSIEVDIIDSPRAEPAPKQRQMPQWIKTVGRKTAGAARRVGRWSWAGIMLLPRGALKLVRVTAAGYSRLAAFVATIPTPLKITIALSAIFVAAVVVLLFWSLFQ